jgi:hypothetical protein
MFHSACSKKISIPYLTRYSRYRICFGCTRGSFFTCVCVTPRYKAAAVFLSHYCPSMYVYRIGNSALLFQLVLLQVGCSFRPTKHQKSILVWKTDGKEELKLPDSNYSLQVGKGTGVFSSVCLCTVKPPERLGDHSVPTCSNSCRRT